MTEKAATLMIKPDKIYDDMVPLPGCHALFPKAGNHLYFHYTREYSFKSQTFYRDTRKFTTPALKYSFIVEAEAALYYKAKNGKWFVIPLVSSVYNGHVLVRVKLENSKDAEQFFSCNDILATRNGLQRKPFEPDGKYPDSYYSYGWRDLADNEYTNYANRRYAAGPCDDYFLDAVSADFERDYYQKHLTIMGKDGRKYHPCRLNDKINDWIDPRRPSATIEEAKPGKY